jgi:hypothetical protein
MTIILIACLIVAIAANVYQYTTNLETSRQNEQTMTPLVMKNVLTDTQARINNDLQALDAGLLDACAQLSTTDLTGNRARAILDDLVANYTLIVNAATANANDILLAVQPKMYTGIEGQDVSHQPQNIEMHKTMRPAMSDLIPLVEGFNGVVMVAPIFNAQNQFIGSLSIVIHPETLIKNDLPAALDSAKLSMWAMQQNGTLIYDPDPAQQSKNLFSDPIYQDFPEVQTFAHQVAQLYSGYNFYKYYDKNLSDSTSQVVTKEGIWVTIGIYNAQWRLVITHIIS